MTNTSKPEAPAPAPQPETMYVLVKGRMVRVKAVRTGLGTARILKKES